MQQPPNDQPEWQPQYPQHTQYPQQPYQQTGPGVPPQPQYTQYPPYQQPPYPYQPPPPPPVQSNFFTQQVGCLPIWAILLITVIVACVGASYASYSVSKRSSITTTASNSPNIAATNSAQLAATNTVEPFDSGSTPDTSPAHFKVGQTATTPDGFIVTIRQVYTSRGDQYDTPKTGNQYLVVDASVKNTTGKVQHMSSGQFTLTDSTGQQIDDTVALLQEVHYFVGGTLQDGATMRGQLVYEVPKGNHPYELIFMGNMFGDYQTFWDIHS